MIADTDDISVISAIKDFFTIEQKDFWEELNVEQKHEIKKSLNEFDAGKYSDFQEFIFQFK